MASGEPSAEQISTESFRSASEKETEVHLAICFTVKESNFSWIAEQFNKDPSINSLKHVFLCEYNDQKWEAEAEKFTCFILYHSMSSEKSIEDGLIYLEPFRGQDFRKVIIIVDNVKDTKSEEDIKRKCEQKFDVLCFSEAETLFMSPTKNQVKTVRAVMAYKLGYMRNIMERSKEKENIIVVLDDQEDTSLGIRYTILMKHPIIRDLFIFSREEKASDYQEYLGELYEVEEKIQKKKSKLKAMVKRRDPRSDGAERINESPVSTKIQDPGYSLFQMFQMFQNWISVSCRHIIGIFSRSGQDDYNWLLTQLKSDEFENRVQDVVPHYISNSNFTQFRVVVSKCTYGILYHTKRRGRINVTDVTDSLYDDELNHLSVNLGKKNVIVVIDDLEDSSPEEQDRILKSQPSIGKLAQDLIIVSENEKKHINKPGEPVNKTSLMEKIHRIKELLK